MNASDEWRFDQEDGVNERFAVGTAVEEAVLAERARIRQELLDLIDDDAAQAGAEPHYFLADRLRHALDRICPKVKP